MSHLCPECCTFYYAISFFAFLCYFIVYYTWCLEFSITYTEVSHSQFGCLNETFFFSQNWPLNYLSWYSLPTYLLQPEVWYYYNKTLLMQISREQVSSGICWEGSWRRQSSWVFLMRSAIQFGFAGTCVLCKLTWSVKKWKKKKLKIKDFNKNASFSCLEILVDKLKLSVNMKMFLMSFLII